MKWCKGVTLVELMIVVAIAAILATIGYPAYTSQVQKANRSAAQQFLMEVALAQDQYILDSGGYAADLATLGFTPPSDVASNYTVTIPTVTTSPPGYVIQAVPKTGSRMEGTSTLKLHSDGTKEPAGEW